MVTNNFISESEGKKVKATPIQLNFKKVDENNASPPISWMLIREEVKKWCKENKDQDGENYDIYEDGLKIYTTINPRMQLYAEEAVAKHMPVLQRVLSAQASLKTDAVWKTHDNILQAAMKNSDRWEKLKEDGLSDADIKKTFYVKTKMKVFAWNPMREKDTLMTPYDSIKYHREMLQQPLW
jgi:penicillin-binding protein 1A